MQRDSVLRVIAISDLRRVGQELTCGSAKLTGGQRTRELLHFRSTFYSIRNKLRGGGQPLGSVAAKDGRSWEITHWNFK